MKTPSEIPGFSCSQGKLITTISAAWLPVNNMTHKLIMPLSLLHLFSSLLPLTLSHSITPMTATPPAWCPTHFPSAAHSFQSGSHLNDRGRGGQTHQAFFEVGGGGPQLENTWRITLTSAQPLQVSSDNFILFWSSLLAPCQVPW